MPRERLRILLRAPAPRLTGVLAFIDAAVIAYARNDSARRLACTEVMSGRRRAPPWRLANYSPSCSA